MFALFLDNMKSFATNTENLKADNSINWNYVDADMFEKWQVLVDGETYSEWFNSAADIVEGVEV